MVNHTTTVKFNYYQSQPRLVAQWKNGNRTRFQCRIYPAYCQRDDFLSYNITVNALSKAIKHWVLKWQKQYSAPIDQQYINFIGKYEFCSRGDILYI